MPGMDSGLNATNPALVSAFWSALLHQLSSWQRSPWCWQLPTG